MNLQNQRHRATHWEGWGANSTMSATLAFVAAQTAPLIFYPFFRRNMGTRFWNVSAVVGSLVIMAIAVYLRLRFPIWNYTITGPLNIFRFPVFAGGQNAVLLDANGSPTSEGLWSVILPFGIFALIWLKYALARLRSAEQAIAKGQHSKSAGWSALESIHKSVTTRTVQCVLEPLYLLVIGFFIMVISPALGSFILYAAIPYFLWEVGMWRGLTAHQQDAADAAIHADYEQGMHEGNTIESLARQYIKQAEPEPQPEEEPHEDEDFMDAEAEIPPEIRAKFMEKLKRGK